MSQEKQTKISDPAKKRFQKYLDEPYITPEYAGSGKLKAKVALITGGDSGIGRAVALHFAREGADVAIVFLESGDDAQATRQLVEAEGKKCMLIQGDVSDEKFCKEIVHRVKKEFNRLDILVNNAGTHEEDQEIQHISKKQLIQTFSVNIFSFFYLTQVALSLMQSDSCIINTASITAYKGSDHLLDYSASKGAIVSFTRSLAKNLASKNIRVNGVAPGPVWTPLVVYSFTPEHLDQFGKDTPLGRAGLPREIAPAFVFLACQDSSFITGQMIHVNGGRIVNG